MWRSCCAERSADVGHIHASTVASCDTHYHATHITFLPYLTPHSYAWMSGPLTYLSIPQTLAPSHRAQVFNSSAVASWQITKTELPCASHSVSYGIACSSETMFTDLSLWVRVWVSDGQARLFILKTTTLHSCTCRVWSHASLWNTNDNVLYCCHQTASKHGRLLDLFYLLRTTL